METKKLEVFEKIVELSSLTKAAEELGLTQSGVSHILAGLEEELGFPLLRRSRVGTRLTPEGERLMPFIRETVRAQERLDQTAADLRGLAAGTVRVATFTSVAVHWLPGMMQEFQALYPKVDFRLFNGDYHDVDRWLTDGSADVGFVTLPTSLKCECVPLKEDRLLAVLPKGHPLAAEEICRVRDVAREPFISLLETSDDDARRALEAAEVKPNVRFTTKDDYAIIAMVEQGLGVSIMPELLLQGHRNGIAARPLDPPASRMLALAVPAGDRAGPATRRFAEFVREWVEKNARSGETEDR
ncbi:MAG: LysR family transcriptional regulator [Oscillospiraceae bacterium]|nr:LysR family transcriptional regulator [Oscillospiraceae bacterium]